VYRNIQNASIPDAGTTIKAHCCPEGTSVIKRRMLQTTMTQPMNNQTRLLLRKLRSAWLSSVSAAGSSGGISSSYHESNSHHQIERTGVRITKKSDTISNALGI
jgi:hypothetical protein